MRANQTGFSLLEIIIGFGLLATGLLTMVEMFPVARQAAERGRNELIATHLAQAYLAREVSSDFLAMANGQYHKTEELMIDGLKVSQGYEISVNVTPSQAAGLSASGSAVIGVQVQWREQSFGHQANYGYVRLETVRARQF